VLAASIITTALIKEAASTSETLVNFYQITRRNNTEDSHHQSEVLQNEHFLLNYLNSPKLKIIRRSISRL
jgi:hypothetical protein